MNETRPHGVVFAPEPEGRLVQMHRLGKWPKRPVQGLLDLGHVETFNSINDAPSETCNPAGVRRSDLRSVSPSTYDDPKRNQYD